MKRINIMRKALALGLAIAALWVPAANASIILSPGLVDQAYSSGIDPITTPALLVTGTWDLTDGDLLSVPLINWNLTLTGSIMNIGGTDIYAMRVEGQHEVPTPSMVFGATLGMANTAGTGGVITVHHDHTPPGDGDYWRFEANIDPAGTMNIDVRAAHSNTSAVPEPATMLLLGSGLLGLVGYGRKKFFKR